MIRVLCRLRLANSINLLLIPVYCFISSSSSSSRQLTQESNRSQIPDLSTQKVAEDAIRDLFRDELKAKDPRARRNLAEKLLLRGIEPSEELPVRYVFLRLTVELASETVEGLPIALKAIDFLAKAFEVRPFELRVAAVISVRKGVLTPEKARLICDISMQLAQDALAEDEIDAAMRLSKEAEQVARNSKDSSLIRRTSELVKECAVAGKEWPTVQKSRVTLDSNPDEPAANAVVGRYLCFRKGNWKAGIQFLKRANDSDLRLLADMELRVKDVDSHLLLAERWFSFSQKPSLDLWERRASLARGMLWMEVAAQSAPGGMKDKIDRRIAEMHAKSAPPGGVDLLMQIDPKRDSVSGNWSIVDGKLVLPSSPLSRIEIPFQPCEEYDLIIHAEIGKITDMVILGIPTGDKQCIVLLGPDFAAVEYVDGKPWTENKRSVPGLLTVGKANSIVYMVRQSEIIVTVDGKRVFDWKGDFARLSLHPDWAVPNNKCPFLGSGPGITYSIARISILLHSGRGRTLR